MEVLLIVPYGIETLLMVSLLYLTLNLLIVPYGIETLMEELTETKWKSFNRTLWN